MGTTRKFTFLMKILNFIQKEPSLYVILISLKTSSMKLENIPLSSRIYAQSTKQEKIIQWIEKKIIKIFVQRTATNLLDFPHSLFRFLEFSHALFSKVWIFIWPVDRIDFSSRDLVPEKYAYITPPLSPERRYESREVWTRTFYRIGIY